MGGGDIAKERTLFMELFPSVAVDILSQERSVMSVAIKCYKKDCKFRDKRGYCTLDGIEIDENGKCDDYEPIKRKKLLLKKGGN